MKSRAKKIREKGFSLIELLVALTILLILTSFVISAFTSSLRSLSRESGMAERDANVKRVLELMSIELSQAGVTPEFINDRDLNAVGTTLQTDPNNSMTVSLTNPAGGGQASRGFYPGRPIILELPDTKTTSQSLTIADVAACSGNPCSITLKSASASHAAGSAVSSPMLPLMFGVLNPPPLTPGTPARLPLTTASRSVPRIGVVGDILSNGNLYYLEYRYDAVSGRIFRSLTPLNPNDTTIANPNAPNKAPEYVLIDNVRAASFAINYASLTVPIPVSITVSVTARTNVPEPKIAGGSVNIDNAYKAVSATTDIIPRGTSSAALIYSNNAEQALRAMMPPCTGPTGSKFPPCTEWNTGAWPWWQNVVNNYALGLP